MIATICVKDREFKIQCGTGEQLIKWLAFIAARTYCEAATLHPDQCPPLYVINADNHLVSPILVFFLLCSQRILMQEYVML